jgi:hypothetical protein
MPNKLLMNFTWPTTLPFATHFALPFLNISIASIPERVNKNETSGLKV